MKDKEKQIKLSFGKKSIIFIVLGFLIFVILIILIWFSFENIKKESENLALQKIRIIALANQNIQIESFKVKYKSYLPNLQKIEEMFVDPQNPLKFIEFLEKSSSDAGVILEISPLSFLTEGTVKTVSVRITVKGDFNDILKFLEEIESGKYLLSVESLTISNFEEKSEKGESINKSQAIITTKTLSK
jgi:hypothetical protein